MEYWIENDKLKQFIKNQQMRTSIPTRPHIFGGGFIENLTFYSELIKDSNGNKIYTI